MIGYNDNENLHRDAKWMTNCTLPVLISIREKSEGGKSRSDNTVLPKFSEPINFSWNNNQLAHCFDNHFWPVAGNDEWPRENGR
jgi:hypothetical protein